MDAEVLGDKLKARGLQIHHDEVEVGNELEKFEAGEADGAGADDEDGVSGLGVSALNGVVSDGEGFDEGELIVGKGVAGVEFAGGNGPEALAEAAGLMDADDLQAGTTVGVAFLGNS